MHSIHTHAHTANCWAGWAEGGYDVVTSRTIIADSAAATRSPYIFSEARVPQRNARINCDCLVLYYTLANYV